MLTAAATALGLAVVVSPAADAARPEPTYSAKLALRVLDSGVDMPRSAQSTAEVGFVRPGSAFNVTVTSLNTDGTPLVVGKDTDIALSGTDFSGTVTILKGASDATKSFTRAAETNFTMTATGPKNAGYEPASLPVTVGLQSFFSSSGIPANQFTGVKKGDNTDCALSAENPTCIRLSVDGAQQNIVIGEVTYTDNVLLSTSPCKDFFTKDGQPLDCSKGKGSNPPTALVAQTFVDLLPGQVATAILDCDKSVCGNGGVSQYVPLFDKGNTGEFIRLQECPAKNSLGDLHSCFDKQQSTRDNAGDLHTYILFDKDARTLH